MNYPRRHYSKARFASLILLVVTIAGLPSVGHMHAQAAPAAWPSEWMADSAFYNLWARTDGPVSTGAASRSWVWGPLPFSIANEEYAESLTGSRVVEYFDKGRMEINDVAADRSTPWFVTSGLLVNEMVKGRVQTGNDKFESRQAADVPVAGDAGDPNSPTYASFARVTAPSQDASGKVVSQQIDRSGGVSPFAVSAEAQLVATAYFDDVSRHNVPVVFADWLKQAGTVLEGGRAVQGQIVDPLFVVGRPITDAFWADIRVNGAPATVLEQLFERRALTYNPQNAPEWRVEMANVGRAYYDWRYGDAPSRPAISGEITASGIAVHGWRWPPGRQVGVRIEWPSDGGVLAGPVELAPDSEGRFELTVPYNQHLHEALRSGAVLRLSASSGDMSSTLPLAGKPGAGGVHIEGTVRLVERGEAGERLVVGGLDSKEWQIRLPEGASVTTSEGSAASVALIDAGTDVVVEGDLDGGVVTAHKMRLMSTSGMGARIGYEWSADGSSLLVTGIGWPGERSVSFAGGTASEPGEAFATLRSDSRGNLTGRLKLPQGMASQALTWLYASGSDLGNYGVAVVLPVALLGTPARPAPTQLYITSRTGAQIAAIASYCTAGKCVDIIQTPLLADGLTVQAGEIVGMRAQSGSNPLISPTASRLSVQIYTYPTGETGGLLAGNSIYSTGELPGRPFSLAIPHDLHAGRYEVVVSASWPDSGGGRNSGVYLFVLQVR